MGICDSGESVDTAELVPTTAFGDQKPGTSGLRKKVSVFEQSEHYLENFVQAIFNTLGDKLPGCTLVVGGDGRYYNQHAVQVIVQMAKANGVGAVLVGAGGLLSTPALSAVIRARKALGGILLTASHNPGGPDGDFGIKYNAENGGPAPEKLTDAIFEASKALSQFRIDRSLALEPAQLASPGKIELDGFTVEVISPTDEYVRLLRTIFDFEAVRALLAREDFKFKFDGMHGVAGPYARELFCTELGAGEECLMNCEPKPDFGGGHPDPNLTYAAELVRLMGLDSAGGRVDGWESAPDFAAAADGDADRNMILGKGFFVTPSDSVAAIAAHAEQAIPYFKDGVVGVARSMPTSKALDRVAAKRGWAPGVNLFETPTGWKFFGNLMDSGKISICGEESFGTGSNHIREKDGLWAVLAWLSILAHANKETPVGGLMSVEQLMNQFWSEHGGRVYYQRYDYEGIPEADGVFAAIEQFGASFNSTKLDGEIQPKPDGYSVFSYTDPVDDSTASNQGWILQFTGPGISAARAIFRKSGTGSSGVTIRLYLEVESDDGESTPTAMCAGLAAVAVKLAKIEEVTGMKRPTVIT